MHEVEPLFVTMHNIIVVSKSSLGHVVLLDNPAETIALVAK